MKSKSLIMRNQTIAKMIPMRIRASRTRRLSWFRSIPELHIRRLMSSQVENLRGLVQEECREPQQRLRSPWIRRLVIQDLPRKSALTRSRKALTTNRREAARSRRHLIGSPELSLSTWLTTLFPTKKQIVLIIRTYNSLLSSMMKPSMSEEKESHPPAQGYQITKRKEQHTKQPESLVRRYQRRSLAMRLTRIETVSRIHMSSYQQAERS